VTVASRLLIATLGGGAIAIPIITAREALYNGSDADGPYSIGAATFDGSTNWIVYGSNPVITPGAGGTWFDVHIKDPWLMLVDDARVCFASGYDGSVWRIGVWDGASLTSWTPDAANPVVDVGAGGSDSELGVQFPVVLHEPADTGREWKMWTSGLSADGKYRVIYHYSSDRENWTTFGTVMGPTGAGTFADEGVVPTAVLKIGSTYHLFGGGRQGTTVPRWQGWHTSFTDPETTYTTPTLVLEARFNDAGTSASLTADTLSGDDTVEIADTSPFNVNEPVALIDTDSGIHVASIESIDSGTQLTLTVPPGADMTVAQGALLRPLAWNSVQPRSVLPAAAGGFEMFFTPFQVADDLSVAGVTLREGSMRATSATIDGSWAYDYDTGLMFPLHDGGWDNLSAENPSVIVAPAA
jgi:hypothetical protein